MVGVPNPYAPPTADVASIPSGGDVAAADATLLRRLANFVVDQSLRVAEMSPIERAR